MNGCVIIKRYALFAAFCMLAYSAPAQYRGQGKIIEDRLLVWDDFKGKGGSDYNVALTFTSIEIEPFQLSKGGPVPEFKAVCYFVPKESWVDNDFIRKSNDDDKAYVLNHEQLHYNIARIVTIEINEAMNGFKYDKNRIKQQADSIFRAKMTKLRQIQVRYDTETNHSRVKEEQEKWNGIVAEGMEKKRLPDM